MEVPTTENGSVSDEPYSYNITVIIFSSSTCHLPPCTSISSELQVYAHFTLPNHGAFLFLFILEFLLFGLGRMGCDLHLSHMNLETVPCQSGHLSSGLPWRIFALMSVSSAIIGEMIRSSWHVWPHSSGMSAGSSRPLGNQSCFLAVLSIRNSPEWHLSTVLSMLTRSPISLLLQVHGNTDFEPAVFHHRVGLFHFSLRVSILPPCFILSRLSQKI